MSDFDNAMAQPVDQAILLGEGCCGPGAACSREDCTGTPFPAPGMRAIFRDSTDPANFGEERLLVLGTQPCILIEPEYADDGNQVVNFLVDVTDQNILEAADLLSAIADTLRAEADNVVPQPVPEDTEDRAIASGDLVL